MLEAFDQRDHCSVQRNIDSASLGFANDGAVDDVDLGLSASFDILEH